MMKMVVLLLLVAALPLPVAGSQCSSSSDCPSPHAPHCSKWGWCQWTGLYGQEGPVQLPPGECVSSRDCTPRAPVCSSLGYCTQSTQHNPLIQRSRSKPLGAVQVTVPAGTIHLSATRAKTQAKDLRQRGVSEGRTLIPGEEYQANHRDDGDKYQTNHGDDIYQKRIDPYEIYRTNKGDQGLAGPQYQDAHGEGPHYQDAQHGGPQNNNDQPFHYNLPTGMEREQVRHAWLEAESGNRQINVFLKSQKGHRGVDNQRKVDQQAQANIKHRDQLAEDFIGYQDQLPQGSIAHQQKLEPLLVANRFKKDENKLPQNNYSPHLPLSNTPRTDKLEATLQSTDQAPALQSTSQDQAPALRSTSQGQAPALQSTSQDQAPALRSTSQGQAPALQSASQGQAPSQHFNPVAAVPNFGQKTHHDSFDYPDFSEYPDYYRTNRNDEYNINDQEYYYYDDYYYDYSLGTQDILKKNALNDDDPLNSETLKMKNDYSDDDKVDFESYDYSHVVRINKISLSNDQPSVNKKSTNRFPFITENKSEGRKSPSRSSNKATSKPAPSNPAPSNPAPSKPAPSKPAPSNPAPSRPTKLAKIVENPAPGVSQGCLIDCVYECVAIELLSAYRDCVKFCGNACT